MQTDIWKKIVKKIAFSNSQAIENNARRVSIQKKIENWTSSWDSNNTDTNLNMKIKIRKFLE